MLIVRNDVAGTRGRGGGTVAVEMRDVVHKRRAMDAAVRFRLVL